MSIHRPPRLYFELLKLLNFDFNADADPAFHSHADPDPAFHSHADPVRIRIQRPTKMRIRIRDPVKYVHKNVVDLFPVAQQRSLPFVSVRPLVVNMT